MKAIWFFYIGLVIDLYGLVVSVLRMLLEQLNGSRGLDNPAFFILPLLLTALIIGAFWSKWKGRLKLGTSLIWSAAAPLLVYGIYVYAFSS